MFSLVRLSNFQLLESLNCKHKLFRFGKLSTQNENNKSASETVNNDKMWVNKKNSAFEQAQHYQLEDHFFTSQGNILNLDS